MLIFLIKSSEWDLKESFFHVFKWTGLSKTRSEILLILSLIIYLIISDLTERFRFTYEGAGWAGCGFQALTRHCRHRYNHRPLRQPIKYFTQSIFVLWNNTINHYIKYYKYPIIFRTKKLFHIFHNFLLKKDRASQG